jgi:prevent-host-death family protein
MTSVGVRDLRQRASELLRLVQLGETIQVTDRGRPVAILGPLPDRGTLDQLRATGDVTSATGDPDDLPEPIALPAGVSTASSVLAGLRAEER